MWTCPGFEQVWTCPGFGWVQLVQVFGRCGLLQVLGRYELVQVLGTVGVYLSTFWDVHAKVVSDKDIQNSFVP